MDYFWYAFSFQTVFLWVFVGFVFAFIFTNKQQKISTYVLYRKALLTLLLSLSCILFFVLVGGMAFTLTVVLSFGIGIIMNLFVVSQTKSFPT